MAGATNVSPNNEPRAKAVILHNLDMMHSSHRCLSFDWYGVGQGNSERPLVALHYLDFAIKYNFQPAFDASRPHAEKA
jgi:hypothetical protein